MVAEGPTGVESEIGSFQLTNEQQRWIWEHRQVLTGQVAEVRAMNVMQAERSGRACWYGFIRVAQKLGCLCIQKAWLAGTQRNPEARSTSSKMLRVGARRCKPTRFDSYRHLLVNMLTD